MRALDQIAGSIRAGYVHSTTVLNTLIETENEGGLNAVRHIERHLDNGMRAMLQRQHPRADLVQAWLGATRAYLVSRAEQRQAI